MKASAGTAESLCGRFSVTATQSNTAEASAESRVAFCGSRMGLTDGSTSYGTVADGPVTIGIPVIEVADGPDYDEGLSLLKSPDLIDGSRGWGESLYETMRSPTSPNKMKKDKNMTPDPTTEVPGIP